MGELLTISATWVNLPRVQHEQFRKGQVLPPPSTLARDEISPVGGAPERGEAVSAADY